MKFSLNLDQDINCRTYNKQDLAFWFFGPSNFLSSFLLSLQKASVCIIYESMRTV